MARALRHAEAARGLSLPAGLWAEVFERPKSGAAVDVDEDLYGGFVGNNDRRTLNRLRALPPEKLAAERPRFEDGRLDELLFRYRARNFPATLDEVERERWEQHRAARLHGGEGGALTLQAFFDRIDTLNDSADDNGQSRDRRGIDDQEVWAENMRKMFLAMAEDMRVVLIKLADRLHNMTTLSALPEAKRRRISHETLEIYAPLASRLGIWQVKWQLEDLGFRHLHPREYADIAAKLSGRLSAGEGYIARVIEMLQAELAAQGLRNAEIASVLFVTPKTVENTLSRVYRKVGVRSRVELAGRLASGASEQTSKNDAARSTTG